MNIRIIAQWILPVLPCFLFSVPAFATTWEIETKTCDLKGAGTDSAVEVEIVGTTRRSTHRLGYTPDRDDFARDQVDTYRISTPKIGNLDRVRITVLGNDGWCMESIKARNLTSGAEWSWDYDNWLDRDSSYPATTVCRVGKSRCE